MILKFNAQIEVLEGVIKSLKGSAYRKARTLLLELRSYQGKQENNSDFDLDREQCDKLQLEFDLFYKQIT